MLQTAESHKYNTSADVGFACLHLKSVSEADGLHVRAPREGRADVLHWLGHGNRQKGVSRFSRPLAAVASRGSAQSTSHPNKRA